MARAVQRRPLVGSRTGARRPRFSLSVAPRFLWDCLTSRIVRWFPAPASSNPACRFPALGFPVCFTSRVMWPTRAGWLSADGSSDSVLVKQSECVIEPLRIPPLPAGSFAPSGAHQVPPNLLLHPELNVGKAPARVPYRDEPRGKTDGGRGARDCHAAVLQSVVGAKRLELGEGRIRRRDAEKKQRLRSTPRTAYAVFKELSDLVQKADDIARRYDAGRLWNARLLTVGAGQACACTLHFYASLKVSKSISIRGYLEDIP
jgi:hypothetical protein